MLPLAKCVPAPVTVTLRLSAWRPLVGFTCAIAAVSRVTLKNDPEANDEAIWPPVVSVTVRLPTSASALMVILTFAVVAPVTLTVLTVIPGPKLARGRAVDEARELSDDRDVEGLTLLAGARADGGQSRRAGQNSEGVDGRRGDLTVGRQHDRSRILGEGLD